MTARTIGFACGLLLIGAGVWIADLKDELALQKARYEARIAGMSQEVSEKEKVRAEAVAAVERAAREKLEREAARVALLAAELSDARAQLAKNRKDFDVRLKEVSLVAARDCRGLSADWVRLYNEALGLAGSGGGPGGEGADPAGTAAPAGQAGTVGTGVRGDALTTPEDVLAHVRDYGGYCRNLEAQARALVKVVQ